MNIYQQIVDVCREREGETFQSDEIKRAVHARFGTNPLSVIPSDYCYNRWNRGARNNEPLFIRLDANSYKYVGPSFPYTGLVFWRARGMEQERVIGEWVDGKRVLYANVELAPNAEAEPKVAGRYGDAGPPTTDREDPSVAVLPLSAEQLDRLFMQYMEVLKLEVGEFGCSPTETRHLIGRLGELFCARLTGGSLARQVNQAGFDVIAPGNRKISVKTTAQKAGFVSINSKTADRADELMVLRYVDDDFEVVYHGEIGAALAVARPFNSQLELDIGKARRLWTALQNSAARTSEST